jgi:hypothetical protein
MFSKLGALALLVANGANGNDSLIMMQRSAALKISSSKGQKIDWDVCNSQVYSNLGGLGGDNPPGTVLDKQEIRYKSIAKIEGGQAFDMVIVNTTEYTPNPENPAAAAEAGNHEIGGQYLNGKKECMARFNMYSPGEVTLKFTIVLAGTDTPAPSDYTYDFTVFDFDGSKKGSMEQVEVSGIDSWVESKVPPTIQGDKYIFNPTSKQVDNPSDPFDMTGAQMGASVGLVYSEPSWDITFRSIDTSGSGETGGRNFMFAGRSLIHEKGTEHTTTTTTCVRDEDGVCVVYQDPHIDGFDNPNQGPFLTRVSIFDSKQKMSLLGFHRHAGVWKSNDRASWSQGREPSNDVNVYDRGDFWLVKNEVVQIQGRYNISAEFGGSRSGLSALAIGGPALGGGKVFVEPKNGAVVVFGERIRPVQDFVTDTKAGPVRARTYYNAFTEGGVAPSGVDIALPSNIFLQVRRYNTHLDAKITIPRSAGRTDGQCGNFNGDPLDDSLEDVEKRMTSMSIAREDLLFAKPFYEQIA